MVLLKRFYGDAFGSMRTDCSYAGFDGADCGEYWNPLRDGKTANSDLIISWSLAAWGVNDQMNLIVLHHIKNMGPTFGNFEEAVYFYSSVHQGSGCAAGGEAIES
jgi:hypothetical protein